MNYLNYIKSEDAESPSHFTTAMDILLYHDFVAAVNIDIKQLNEHIKKYNSCENEEEQLALLKNIYSLRENMNNLYPLDFIAHCPTYQQQIHDKLEEDLRSACIKLNHPSLAILANLEPHSLSTIEELIAALPHDKLTELAVIFWENKDVEKRLGNLVLPEPVLSLFNTFLSTHMISVLPNSNNSRNIVIERKPSNGSSSVVLKLDLRLGTPKESEQMLRQKGFKYFPNIHGIERQITFALHEKPITTFVTITDYFPKADLESHINRKDPLLVAENINSALNFYRQMADIFLEMHELGYTFTDAKNSNWLISDDGQLKIADTKSLVPILQPTGMVDLKSEPCTWLRKNIKASPHLYPSEFLTSKPFSAEQMTSYFLGKNLPGYALDSTID